MTRISAFLPAMLVLASVWIVGARTDLAAGQAGVREGVLYTSVVDKDGAPVTGLGAGDFVVREDGTRREVLRVTPATEPILIALLVDNSVAATDDIRNIRDGVTAFVQ